MVVNNYGVGHDGLHHRCLMPRGGRTPMLELNVSLFVIGHVSLSSVLRKGLDLL